MTAEFEDAVVVNTDAELKCQLLLKLTLCWCWS